MLYTNANAPVYPHDRFLNVILIRFMPRWILPNHLTVLRFCLIPFILWFLMHQNWDRAAFFFILAAFTDALDGSLARIRRQITIWGTFADPAADKLLIGSVALFFMSKGLDLHLVAGIILVELFILIAGLIRYRGQIMVSANLAGKIKMVLQVIGVLLLLVGQFAMTSFFLMTASAVFILSILFGLVSLVTYSL